MIKYIKEVREKFGMGMRDAKRAVEIANERFNGDVELGAWWVHANSLAVLVKGDRCAWNDEYARNMVNK